MSYQPLVSIVTPTYNQAQYIASCLASVRGQTYQSWEQIIIDDGSEDSTPEVVERCADSRTRYIRRKHQGISGLGGAYNTALAMARGELVAILEGDDLWPSTKLAAQVPLFECDDVILSWGKGIVIDQMGRNLDILWEFRSDPEPIRLHARDLVPTMLWSNAVVPSSGVIVRRKALQGIGGFRQPRGVSYVDRPTWLKLISRMKPRECFVYTNEPVAYWRTHPQQVSKDYQRMRASQARVVADFAKQINQQQMRNLNLDPAYLRMVVNFHMARDDLAHRDWRRMREHLRVCWRDENVRMRRRILMVTICYVLRCDFFRVLPFEI